MKILTLATVALALLCLSACGDSPAAPRCTTSTHVDSIAIVAARGDTVAWWPSTISVTVCR